MRSDLDNLMKQRNIDAFIVPASEGGSAARDYLTGGVHNAMIIKKRDEQPVLVVSYMEKDEAAKTGLPVITYDQFGWTEIVRKYGRGTKEARLAQWQRIIEHFDLRGRVTLYGGTEMQDALRLVNILREHFGDRIELIEDTDPNIFAAASETKDAEELAKLRDVGKRTSAVARETRAWLSTHRAQADGQVVDQDGKPLTIGAVKRYLRFKMFEYDLEDPDGGTIFSQGRDAAIPHSRGENDQVLRTGESIILDFFPRQNGGGYFHDMTRTWCLGYAREDVEQTYKTVLEVFWRSMEGVTLGQPTKILDKQVCEWFEAAGHPTRLNSPTTEAGYPHSLGHGIGLDIHESPIISHLMRDDIVFRGGNVVTIEPGLYYPDKGYGVRIEDTVYIDDKGELHNLTDCPYDLVIPLNG